MADLRALTQAERIERLRRSWAEGRQPAAGDIGALLDRLEHLEEQVAQRQRRTARNKLVAALAEQECAGLAPSPAARQLLQLAGRNRSVLPPEAVALLQRIEAHGGLPTTDRQIANILRSERLRDK